MLISDMMISTTRKTPAPTAILAAISWAMILLGDGYDPD